MTYGKWNWLASTEQLQIEAYGNDLRALRGEERDQAFTTHTLAAADELHEALAETSWKAWDKKNVGQVNKEAFKGEIVDALHFVANLLVLAEIDEAELWEAYKAKQQRNRDRQARAGGYDSVANRCPACKRELDKPDAYKLVEQQYIQTDERPEGFMHYTIKHFECGALTVLELPTDVPLPGR